MVNENVKVKVNGNITLKDLKESDDKWKEEIRKSDQKFKEEFINK